MESLPHGEDDAIPTDALKFELELVKNPAATIEEVVADCPTIGCVQASYAVSPVDEPHVLPVLEIVPFAENVAHPAVPPAEETMRFVVEAVPETVSAVVDAYGKVEAVNVDVAVKYAATVCPTTESGAYGELVPIPTFP